ncbi:hypothetical protein Bca4012_055735 [Brassica carinata]
MNLVFRSCEARAKRGVLRLASRAARNWNNVHEEIEAEKKSISQSEKEEEPSSSDDIEDYTPEEVGKLHKELMKLLSRTKKRKSNLERRISNALCPVVNSSEENKEDDMERPISVISAGRCKEISLENGFSTSPNPSLTDTLQKSRMEKEAIKGNRKWFSTHPPCTLPFDEQTTRTNKKKKKIKTRKDSGEFLLSDTFKMSRKENAKAQPPPEKSSFTRRCSLLSRYLKEKGSFGNINLDLIRKPDSDLGLSGYSCPPGKQIAMQKADTETKAKETNLSKSSSELGSSQLTIFFGGQILVYNEFPADKAKEIMEVAKQAKPVTEVNIQTQTNVQNNNNNNNKSNMVLPDLNEPTGSADINPQQQQENQVVERIARRASLHRFFAKRKDRAPYQVNQNGGHHPYPPKPETAHGQPLESGQSSKRPENAVAQTMSHSKPEGDKNTSVKIEEGQCSKDLELRL